MNDSPSTTVSPGVTFVWSWFSIGLILDRCHNYAIKRQRYISWEESGRTDENGEVTFTDGQTTKSLEELDLRGKSTDPEGLRSGEVRD